MIKWFIPLALACFTLSLSAGEGGKGKEGHVEGHVLAHPDKLMWGPAPPALPAGAKVAVLSGNPGKAGPFVIRVNLPDGYKVPLHTHPSDEHVTVLKGTLMVGFVEMKEGSKPGHSSETLPAGGFMRMPKGMQHEVTAKGETILQVHGTGPFELHYVNAKDDPRKK